MRKILNFIVQFNSERRCHNPGIEELLDILTGEIHVMPTCSLAYLKLHISRWSDIDHVRTKGELVDIWVARDLTFF